MKSVSENCAIVVVLNPITLLFVSVLAIETATFAPVISIWPIDVVSVLIVFVINSVLRILISWSLSYFSTGKNFNAFLPKRSAVASKSPNLCLV